MEQGRQFIRQNIILLNLTMVVATVDLALIQLGESIDSAPQSYPKEGCGSWGLTQA